MPYANRYDSFDDMELEYVSQNNVSHTDSTGLECSLSSSSAVSKPGSYNTSL